MFELLSPGRSRLEPVAIIVLSVIMSLASLEVLISSIRKMVGFSSSKEDIANFEIATVVIAASTVGMYILKHEELNILLKKYFLGT